MAGLAKPQPGLMRPSAWFDQLAGLLAHELGPSSRKLRTALRMTVITTIGAALVTICHVNNQLGLYTVWLLGGAGVPMRSARSAVKCLIVAALALIASVVMARLLADTPWLMLSFLFGAVTLLTYLGTIFKWGSALLLIEVLCLDLFYGVVFSPRDIGWSASSSFGGLVIAYGLIVLFDNWLWPDPGEHVLMESLGVNVTRARARLLAASNYYLNSPAAPRPPLPPPTSDLPTHMTMLEQAVAEGVSRHRRAILVGAITRVARINLVIDRLSFTARETGSRKVIRPMVRPELEGAVDALAAALDDLARELPTRIPVGVNDPPPPSRARARAAMNALRERILVARPAYLQISTPPEIENFASYTNSLEVLTEYLERLLDEPPEPLVEVSSNPVAQLTETPDPEKVRYSIKVGLCIVVGYLVGVVTQRPDLSTILTTVLITALPTYGAALHKMILRIVGSILGGAVSLLAIVVVSPNFTTLPAYLAAIAVVFFISGYCSISSGRVAYAGKQIGTTFALVYAGLSPALDVYEPLWRIWGILLGTFVVAGLAFTLWPEYAGDSLLPRLRKVLRKTLEMAPGASAKTQEEIQQNNSDTMEILAQMLEVADDAQLEGRTSRVSSSAIVDATGALRRIANRFAEIATGRAITTMPPLDATTESARKTAYTAMVRQLQSWLDFFNSEQRLLASVAHQVSEQNRPDEVGKPVEEFASRIEEGAFARVSSWTLVQRRALLAEIQAMRRLSFLVSRLNQEIAQIPGPAANPRGG